MPETQFSSKDLTASLSSRTDQTLRVPGRHDPCIVPRAVPCVEAALAVALYDMILQGGDPEWN